MLEAKRGFYFSDFFLQFHLNENAFKGVVICFNFDTFVGLVIRVTVSMYRVLFQIYLLYANCSIRSTYDNLKNERKSIKIQRAQFFSLNFMQTYIFAKLKCMFEKRKIFMVVNTAIWVAKKRCARRWPIQGTLSYYCTHYPNEN